MKRTTLFIILGAIGAVAVTGVIIYFVRKKKKEIEESAYDIVNTMPDPTNQKLKVVIAKTVEFNAGDKVGIRDDLYTGKYDLLKVDSSYNSTVLYVDTPYQGITRGIIWKV